MNNTIFCYNHQAIPIKKMHPLFFNLNYNVMKKAITIFVSLVIITILYSCHHTRSAIVTPPGSGGSEMLFQYQWNFIEVNGKPVSLGTDTARLLFYPGQVSRVSGSTGCNRLNGTFELSEGHKIKFSPLVTTKMACPGVDELQLLTALGEVNNWSIINNELLLSNGGVQVAKLQRVSATQPK
jgi:heat shock protein HslJ